MKPRLALLLGSLAAAGAIGRAEVEFAGYLCSPSDLKFVLTDRAARQTSDSLRIGGSFAGYRVTAFEAKTETLTVEKDGALLRLRLKNAGLIDARAASGRETSPPSTSSPDRLALAGAQRLIASATDAQIKLIREQQLQLVRQQDALWQAAARLRETLPADHPQRIAAEAELAKGAQRFDRTTLQLERIVLLNEIRAAGTATPQRVATLEARLRDLDARIARVTAALAPPPPPAK